MQRYIVVAEPDDLIGNLLERWLSEAGYRVMPAQENPNVAMVKPELVIVDISNPASAGATIGALRSAYDAPILALSARFRRGLGGSNEAAQRLQVGKVLPKPFTRQELLDAIRAAVGKP